MKCLRERVSRWTTRQQLEAASHNWSATFGTLTYATAHRPRDRAELRSHLRAFFKRLRALINYNLQSGDVPSSPTPAMVAGFSFGRFRYFAAMEYGEAGGREHFHFNLFGLSPEQRIGERSLPELIEAAWSFGRVYIKPFREGAARYVAKYLLKAVGQQGDTEARLGPEYRTMSNGGGRSQSFGGIGAMALPELAASHDREADDVDRKVTIGNGYGFLDRYLSDRLRVLVGFTVERIAVLRIARLRELVERSRERRWRELNADLGVCFSSPAEFRRYWASAS